MKKTGQTWIVSGHKNFIVNIVEVFTVLQQEVLRWHTGTVRRSSRFQGTFQR